MIPNCSSVNFEPSDYHNIHPLLLKLNTSIFLIFLHSKKRFNKSLLTVEKSITNPNNNTSKPTTQTKSVNIGTISSNESLHKDGNKLHRYIKILI